MKHSVDGGLRRLAGQCALGDARNGVNHVCRDRVYEPPLIVAQAPQLLAQAFDLRTANGLETIVQGATDTVSTHADPQGKRDATSLASSPHWPQQATPDSRRSPNGGSRRSSSAMIAFAAAAIWSRGAPGNRRAR